MLAGITPEQVEEIAAYEKRGIVHVHPSDKDFIFDIQVRVNAAGHTAFAEIAGFHTNVIRLEQDGAVLLDRPYTEGGPKHATDRSFLTVERIVEFADAVKIADVQPVLQRQIDCNTAIAREGLQGQWGANIGRILLESYGDSTHNRAKAWAAAGSDARMNGCELPVVINSGSGNQGLTALAASDHLRPGAGLGAGGALPGAGGVQPGHHPPQDRHRQPVRLPAGPPPPGAVPGPGCATCTAAGTRRSPTPSSTAVAIDSGMICDGAKASCAAKIASAVEAGLLGWKMQQHHSQFYGGDGIVVKGVENTIRNVGTLASEGMRETDRTIIRLMTSGCAERQASQSLAARRQTQTNSNNNRPAGRSRRCPRQAGFSKSMLAYFSFSRVSSSGYLSRLSRTSPS